MQFAKAAAYARHGFVAALATIACVVVACSDDDDASPKRVTCEYNGKTYVQGSWPCPDDPCNSCRLLCDQDGQISFSMPATTCPPGGFNGLDAESDAQTDADASDAAADVDGSVSDADSDADGGTDSD